MLLGQIQAIDPPRLPLPRRGHGIVKVGSRNEMLERIERRPMSDDEHGLTSERLSDFREPCTDAVDDLLIALAAGEGHRHSQVSLRFNFGGSVPGESAVVAFTKSGISDNCDPPVRECDLGRPYGARQIRTEHRREIVGSTALPERACLDLAFL